MSHISTISVTINNLAALEAAAKEHGCQWLNKKTYEWFGTYMGGKLPSGMTKESLGKCDFAIKLPGVRYEIGVVKLKDGSYTLAYDFYHYEKYGHDGGKLLDKFGDGLKKLVQSYAKHNTLSAFRKAGFLVREVQGVGGKVRLEAQRI